MHPDYTLHEHHDLISPSLLLFPDKIRRNIARMIETARDPSRLRPHVKTHKMPAIVRLVEAAGIHKHKCATIAEAEMLARAGATDVLLSYPPVGPNVRRMGRLVETFPNTTFRALVDDDSATAALNQHFESLGKRLRVLVDLNIGMNRTGIVPGDRAAALYAQIASGRGLIPDGLHAYDGHQRATDAAQRRDETKAGVAPVYALRDRLERDGLPVPRLVLGGSPTFPIHAASDDPAVECSPGTTVLHDAGYTTKFPDLAYEPAAILFTRVISRPAPGLICLDLGHKAVAADPVGDRLQLLGVPDCKFVGQSEEHLVVETSAADRLPPGSPMLAIPMHICPTVALHSRAFVVEQGRVTTTWDVTARERFLSI